MTATRGKILRATLDTAQYTGRPRTCGAVLRSGPVRVRARTCRPARPCGNVPPMTTTAPRPQAAGLTMRDLVQLAIVAAPGPPPQERPVMTAREYVRTFLRSLVIVARNRPRAR
jgi:hypothetical protein